MPTAARAAKSEAKLFARPAAAVARLQTKTPRARRRGREPLSPRTPKKGEATM